LKTTNWSFIKALTVEMKPPRQGLPISKWSHSIITESGGVKFTVDKDTLKPAFDNSFTIIFEALSAPPPDRELVTNITDGGKDCWLIIINEFAEQHLESL
jgi:hypothetical protein